MITDTTYGTTLIVKVAVALGDRCSRCLQPVALDTEAAGRRFHDGAGPGGRDRGGDRDLRPHRRPDRGQPGPARRARGGGTDGLLDLRGRIDFATTTRVELTVTPGVTGPNTFEARVVDFDEDTPVEANEVLLQLAPIGRLDVEDTSLPLEPQGEGMWMAEGTRCPRRRLAGRGPGGRRGATTEVPLVLVTRAPRWSPPWPGRKGCPTSRPSRSRAASSSRSTSTPGPPGRTSST